MNLVEIVAYMLSLMTLLSHVLIGAFVAIFFFSKKTFEKLIKSNKQNFILFSFIVSLVATSGSLFFSEIAKYNPCTLCWYQRIFMYPQVLLLGLAIIKKEKVIINYSLLLSVVGGIIALYHYLMQINLVPSTVCSVVGYSASCSQRFEMEYGYITIPMMSLTAFVLIASFMFLAKKTSETQ